MLYDTRWDRKSEQDNSKKVKKPSLKVKKPSLNGLIAWLEKQDPAKEYDWGCCKNECLISQYLMSIGITGRQQWKDNNYFLAQGTPTPVGCPAIALRTPHTFGAALQRARAVLKEQGE